MDDIIELQRRKIALLGNNTLNNLVDKMIKTKGLPAKLDSITHQKHPHSSLKPDWQNHQGAFQKAWNILAPVISIFLIYFSISFLTLFSFVYSKQKGILFLQEL